MDEYRIMTIAEVQEYMDIGKNRLYELLKENRIKYYKEGKKYKITKKSVDEYIQSRLSEKQSVSI